MTAESVEPVGESVVRRVRRAAKFARRLTWNVVNGRAPDTRVVFIMGSQRSGTRVPLVALESAPDVLTYREGAHPYFNGVKLAPEHTLDRLFKRCMFPVLVLKPLCESHRARELLERFPQARVLWIFRWYEDAVRSSSLKWNSGASVVDEIVAGRLDRDDWRAGGLTPEAVAIARALHRPGLSLHHANAILWYLRNRLVLDLDLFNCSRVLVVKYEDLSTEPQTYFRPVFDFIGERLEPKYLRKIHSRSVRRNPLPQIPAAVIETCGELYAEIDRRYRLAHMRQS